MREDIRDAIESARSVGGTDGLPYREVKPSRTRSREGIRATVLAVIRELPDDMTIAELRDELEICANQQVSQ